MTATDSRQPGRAKASPWARCQPFLFRSAKRATHRTGQPLGGRAGGRAGGPDRFLLTFRSLRRAAGRRSGPALSATSEAADWARPAPVNAPHACAARLESRTSCRPAGAVNPPTRPTRLWRWSSTPATASPSPAAGVAVRPGVPSPSHTAALWRWAAVWRRSSAARSPATPPFHRRK